MLTSERGYFDVPRQVDAQALAEELGISHQAFSEQIRRATGTMIQHGLLIGQESPGDDDESSSSLTEGEL